MDCLLVGDKGIGSTSTWAFLCQRDFQFERECNWYNGRNGRIICIVTCVVTPQGSCNGSPKLAPSVEVLCKISSCSYSD